MPSRREWFMLAGLIGACFAAAGVGSSLTTPALDNWYAALAKPAWTPPNWVFGPVWSSLYFTMAIAAWLVWRRRNNQGARLALALFVLQLALNVVWSGLFFALRNPQAAFIEIVVLWGAILLTLVTFWRISRLAGWLLTPYLSWVTFAVSLNFAIWRLNA